ncbi:MAG: tRNA (adenosine(37)-N6)-threonylcarbamoyltransferase complex transferase subunit TsaD [Bacillota bacterium]|jgi:N6-L-threonylcarbamoyladenine synthase|nr:tRNA (adenosine(37)-N6)-threonylcarbamoyltransferase complex transferase subunit TsaD [Bacillota bacterium]NLM08695.1 tRNA (adenosine(37)-N6)-threonylcarbamoyltransferase complex transferase subunit TsaD [Clostridiales Family XIII bacterium]
MKDGKFITLAFETSCDETSVALVADGREALSNVVSSQIEVHKAFGGVVPEIASRHHLDNMSSVYNKAMEDAGVSLQEVDLIGVTCGPGLVGALLIGLATAKAFAYATKKPLVGVHHIQGHICANYIEHEDLEPPFLALVVSGGHTHLINVKGYNEHTVLGKTRDDAAGEAFDKVARVLGLGYPGGPAIDSVAREGNPHSVEFKRAMLEKDSLDFSFSGLKTGVLNYLNTQKLKGQKINVPDVAAAFQLAVVDVLVAKAMMAAERTGHNKLVLAGGVAANSLLRSMLSEACEKAGITLYYPSLKLCADNAAMIACAAYYKYLDGLTDDMTLDAYPALSL